jgi:hypothetical protein
MGFFGDLFCHTYDLRAEVELKNGEMYKVRCQIQARFVTQEELIFSFKRYVERRLGSPVKRIIEIYDASNM